MDVGTAWFTATPCSFTAWLFIEAMKPNLSSIFLASGTDGTLNNCFRLTINNAFQFLASVINSAGSAASATIPSTPIGTWVHFAGTFTSDTLRTAYVNGGNKTQNTTSKVPTAAVMNISRIGNNALIGTYLDGRVSEVAAWNQVLTDDNVAVLATSGLPTKVPSDGKSS